MSILKIAFSQLGIKEIKGTEDNPEIVKYAQETGIKAIDNDEIPWCSTFVNWCAQEAGLPKSGKPNARSWMSVGKATKNPEPGDIVVFWRESIHSWKGHVGIFLGFNQDASKVFCLGGNQGDSVSVADYNAGKVLGFRKLEVVQKMRVPEKILKYGMKGKAVQMLQIVLNFLDYNCGDADGHFGRNTENALKMLQANNHIGVDGEYGPTTRNIIESLLQA